MYQYILLQYLKLHPIHLGILKENQPTQSWSRPRKDRRWRTASIVTRDGRSHVGLDMYPAYVHIYIYTLKQISTYCVHTYEL